MVRGSRGYSSRGGSGRGSYRSSGTYNRMQSNRRPGGFSDSYSGSSSRYNSSYNSYDSRNREKFQSRYNDNRPESGHKRTYRESSRDRSDDRKRSRQEDSRVNSTYSSSSTPAAYRRTNDSSSRNRASSPATGTSSYHRGSVSGASSYRGRRDGSDSRRHISNNDSMGPPKRPMRSSLIVRPRGGGSMSSSRGMRGSTSMRGGIRIIRKESADIRMMRKKLFYAQQKDRARLLKIARLTSSLRRRKVSRRSSSPSPRSRSRGGVGTSGDKKGSDDDENNDSDDNGEKDKKKIGKKIKNEDKTDEEEEDYDKDDSAEEEEDKNKSKEKLCSSKKGEEFSSAEADGGEVSGTAGEKQSDENVSASIKKEGKKTTEDEKKKIDDGGEGKKSSSKKEKNTSNSSSRTKEKKSDEVEEDSLAKKDKKEYRSRHERSSSGKYSNKYIKLTCPHCHSKYVTFKEYHNHLFSRTHKLAMRNISLRQKAHLQRLRQQQRNAQREIEEKSKEEFDELKPKFCLLCRLNYRQPKAKHQLSEHHKTMKKFLMPYCSSCHLAFKSPMLYEAHRCSLEHIKRKARNNETESDGSRNETREIDLNKFMTVDSVGEIDDVVDEDAEDSDNAVIDGVEDDDNDGKDRSAVGAKFVKKVEAIYCDLCRSYSTYNDNEEASIRKHCLSRGHLKAFIRHKEEEQEAEEAKVDDGEDAGENGELKPVNESLNNEATGEDKEQADDETTGDAEADNADEEGEDQGEDKLWEDVDKDLGDLLREVAPDGQAEDDDEEEDESVLNIDIESEKSKSKEIVNGKKEEPVMNNTHKNKEDNTNVKESVETVESAPVVKPKPPRTIKEKASIPAKTTSSNVQSKVTVASKVVSKTAAKTGKTPTKTAAGTKGVSVKLAKSSAAGKAAATAKAEEKERASLEENNKVADN